jgi:hypothetical protein
MTIPVRSSTPLGDRLTSYSSHSASVGEAELASAIRISAALAPRFTTLTVATVNVVAGTVYTVVSVTADRSAVPNLPVAIIYFSVIFSSKSN